MYMYVCKIKALGTSIVTKEVRPTVKGGKTFLRESLLQMNPFAFKIRHIFITRYLIKVVSYFSLMLAKASN